jgi:hypothetical protein
MEKLVCKFCGKPKLYAIKNVRADRTFEYYVHCKKCKAWVAKKFQDGEIKFLSYPL